MKKLLVLLVAVVFLNVNPAAMAIIYFDDGASHTFGGGIYQSDYVFLDFYSANNPGTHVDLVDGGVVNYLKTFNASSVTMTGGSTKYIYLGGNSTATISGGSVEEFLTVRESASLMMSGGSVGRNLDTWNNATISMTGGLVGGNFGATQYGNITMSGGVVEGGIFGSDNSTATMLGGSVGHSFYLGDNSTATISGGSVGWSIYAHDNSVITMSGGSVADSLLSKLNGIIYLDGKDFAVNGTPLVNGDKLSDFGVLFEYRYNGNIFDYYTGTITGTLADGSDMANRFRISNIGYYAGTADIIIIPEPATLTLLALGGLFLRRRR